MLAPDLDDGAASHTIVDRERSPSASLVALAAPDRADEVAMQAAAVPQLVLRETAPYALHPDRGPERPCSML